MTDMFSFAVTGSAGIDARFAAVGDRAVDARPLWDVLEARFVRMEERQFASEGRGEWDPLSPDYAAWKAEHFPGKTMMRRTDALFHSLTDDLGVSIKEAGMAVFGSDIDSGQQYAARKRPVIDFTDVERLLWVNAARSWIFGGMFDEEMVA